MDKYEYKLKTEQMLELMENGAYNKAAEIADAIDWKRVRNATMLTKVSDIYERNGDYQKSYEVLNIAYHRAEGSRKVLYRLCTLALKTGNVDEAIDYYDDFMQVAPKDPNQHILKYKILRARREPIEQQIEALEEFKKAEYIEEWAYELARLYQEAGMTAECLEECDDLILWFSEGKFVYKAMELKMQYKPLTPSQQEKYDHRYEKLESETEELPDLTQYQARKAELESEDFNREELDEEEERKVDENLLKTVREDRTDETAIEAEMSAAVEENDSSEVTTDPVEPEEPEEVDETIQRLEEKGIGSRMKLEDALKSLLGPKDTKEDVIEEDDEMEEEVPELEAAIEEIEAVIDLELVNELANKSQKERIHFDSDLEELKAEPLEDIEEEAGEDVSEEDELPDSEEDTPDDSIIEDSDNIIEETASEEEELEEIAPEEIISEDEDLSDFEAEELSDFEEEDLEDFEEEELGDVETETEVEFEEEESSDAEAEAEADLEEEELSDAEAEDGADLEEELSDAEAEAEADPEEEELNDTEMDTVEELTVMEESEEESIEESDTAENIKPESNKPAESNQIEGQLSIEDILSDWQEEPAEEVDMEEKKRTAEPILPPDIQRMIDEIEGVLPEEPEPVRPVREEKDDVRENMGEITQQLRIDDIEEFLAAADGPSDDVDDFSDVMQEELESDYNRMEEPEAAEYFGGTEEAYDEADYSEEPEYHEPEYSNEYDVEDEAEGYAAESVEAEDADVYEEDYEDSEYADEYEEESEDSEYADEYEEEYEDGEDADEYEEDYEDGEYADEYEEDYEDSEYADEYEEDEYSDEEYDAVDGYEEADYDDIEASFEEEFRPNPEHANEPDDREIPDDDDEMDILSATTPLSRKETAKLIATGKTSPLPLDEISDALSLSDTGFVVHGRYDLAAQSGIGTRAGLTDEQKKLFSYFVPVRGMSEQLVDVLEQDRNCTNRAGSSRTGNLLIIGNKGNGKTVLAVDVVKAIQKQRNIRQGKVAIVTGDSLNKKKISDIFDKLYGGALIIEKASKMNEKTVARLNKAMERDTGEMLIVLEEQRKPLDRLLSSNREFRRKFTSRLEVPIFINDELVTFGQTYAQENGYRIDEMGILALYSRIDALQREDHAVTVAEVKEVMDEAMAHSQKASAKKLVKRVFGKNTDDADRIILSEKDFNI